jgi:putative transposase
VVEGSGVPVGLAVDGANRPDMKMVRETIESIPVERPEPTVAEPQQLGLDNGYNYAEPKAIVEAFGFTVQVPEKPAEAQAVKRRARAKVRRYVVERSHSWVNRFRGILIRWNKKPANYIAMLHFAFAIITYRCAGLFG